MSNHDKKNEELLKQLASRYMEYEGEKLRREADELNRTIPDKKLAKLDRRVLSYVQRRKRIKILRRACEAAAIFLIVIGVSQFIGIQDQTNHSQQEQKADEMAAGAPEKPEEYELILLTAALPEGFQISDVKQDKEESIYYIENDMLDDVVLSIRKASQWNKEGLKEIIINDTIAYGISKADYKLLTFQQDGFTYTLTCKYEMETIINISKNIF